MSIEDAVIPDAPQTQVPQPEMPPNARNLPETEDVNAEEEAQKFREHVMGKVIPITVAQAGGQLASLQRTISSQLVGSPDLPGMDAELASITALCIMSIWTQAIDAGGPGTIQQTTMQSQRMNEIVEELVRRNSGE